ncbi:MAG: DHA2 family efflux MFS transporter permease subunit [Alphaproteobacteria bacterium]|nr:DHA2 family efflux MFS transporter permease subunit [Alphaproteobacteria bacterium]
MLSTIMQVIDMTIVNVSLPHMQGSLSATQEQISWVLTSYIVAAAAFMPATGFLTARFGRKRLFVALVAGFTVVSMACGAARNIEEMVAFRVLQGMMGAGLVPLCQAVLFDIYPRERHGQVMALWSFGVVIGPIIGPVLGGWLTEHYDWRWCFYINLPLGALALWGIAALLPEGGRDPERRLDAIGFGLLCLAIGALQWMLDRGELLDWFDSGEIVAAGTISALAFVMFLGHLFTSPRPFLDLAMFRDRNFSASLAVVFSLGIALLATISLLPPFLQHLLGFPVLETGWAMAPRGAGTMLGSAIIGRLITRVDTRMLLAIGFALSTLSLWDMMLWSEQVDFWRIASTGFLQGMGLGFLFAPLSSIAFSTLEPRHRADGAALYSLMRNLGSSVGVALVVSQFSQQSQIHRAHLATHVTPFNRALESQPAGDANALALLDLAVNRQAAMLAYLTDFQWLMAASLAAIPLVLLLRPAERR